VIADPPSVSGGAHVTVAELWLLLTATSAVGALGPTAAGLSSIAATVAWSTVARNSTSSWPSATVTGLVILCARFLPAAANRSRFVATGCPSADAEKIRCPTDPKYVSARCSVRT
jgi:hypothetical protein